MILVRFLSVVGAYSESPSPTPMFDLRKLFVRDVRPRGERVQTPVQDTQPISDYHPSSPSGHGLEVEYQALIATQFRRLGITSSSTTIEVRTVGHGAHGHDILVGMVRLHQWERVSALRLLLGLPVLEARIRKLVRATWLADYSHFGGLWLHASEQLHTTPGAQELRGLIRSLTPGPSQPHPESKASGDETAPTGSLAPDDTQPSD